MSISYDLVAELKRLLNLNDVDIDVIQESQQLHHIDDTNVIQQCDCCGEPVLCWWLGLQEEFPEMSAQFEKQGNSFCCNCAGSAEESLSELVMIGAGKIFCMGLEPDEREAIKSELLEAAEFGLSRPVGRERMVFLALMEQDIELVDFPFAEEAVSLCEVYWTPEEMERGTERLDLIRFGDLMPITAQQRISSLLILLVEAADLPLERQEAVYSEVTSRYEQCDDQFPPALLEEIKNLMAK